MHEHLSTSGMEHEDSDSTAESRIPTVNALLVRCQTLYDELQAFREHLQSQKTDSIVELSTFRSTIQAELASLKRLQAIHPTCNSVDHVDELQAQARDEADGGEDDDDDDNVDNSKQVEHTVHLLRSSNVPFLEAVWETAKRSKEVVAFSKRFYWKLPPALARNGASDGPRYRANNKHYASVDIVTDGGAEWVKVSSISESRLLFEIAGQGWPSETDSEDDSQNGDVLGDRSDDDDHQVSLLRMADGLGRAARMTRHSYRHPRLRFVLPKLIPGRVPQIDKIVNTIRSAGITVETGVEISSFTPMSYPNTNNVQPTTAAAFFGMAPNATAHFTSTLNIDCTILLALASDLSHTDPSRLGPPQPWYHAALRRQIEREAQETLLTAILYPAMAARELVCTEEAAIRMKEIVETIGTPTERERTMLILGYEDGNEPVAGLDGAKNREEERRVKILREMQRLSDHMVPGEWKLPVRIVNKESFAEFLEQTSSQGNVTATTANVAPSLAANNKNVIYSSSVGAIAAVSAQFTGINQSVFLFGWKSGLTTITSNRTVVKVIERTIEEWREEAEAKINTHTDADAALQCSENSKQATNNGAIVNRKTGIAEEHPKFHGASDGDGAGNGELKLGNGAGLRDQHEHRNGRRKGIVSKHAEVEIVGPDVWLCGTSRSLIGKEKGRK